MIAKSTQPFVIYPDYIMHPETGQKFPLVKVVAKIPKPTSLAVLVEFIDALSRLRQEEMSWAEYRSWARFSNKMINCGYKCDNLNLLKLLHNWYMTLNILVTLRHLPTGGWWGQVGIDKLYYVPANTAINRSPTIKVLYKASYAQPFSYGLDVLAPDIPSWDRYIAPACGRAPALMVANLSGLAATLFPAVGHLSSFCIFYGADTALEREVIRSAAACVFGAPHNFSILSKPPTPLQLVADFRHAVVCSDIPAQATNKQIQSFFEPLLGISGEISCAPLPPDMRLIALATGPRSQINNVPRSVSVSAMVDPELMLYDSLPNLCTPEQMSVWILSHARQQTGGVGRKFYKLIEKYQSKSFQLKITRLIDDFIKRLQAKTADEKSRAQAVALLWAAGYLGIRWRLLPWKVERLEEVLKQLFAASCKSLPNLQGLEEAAIGTLRQHLIEAKRLTLSRRGHKLEFTAQQVKEADVYLEDNFIYIRPGLLSEWLPGKDGEIAINYLHKHSLFKNSLSGRRTKTVQKTILRDRENFYGINISFLGESIPSTPEGGEAVGGGDTGQQWNTHEHVKVNAGGQAVSTVAAGAGSAARADDTAAGSTRPAFAENPAPLAPDFKVG